MKSSNLGLLILWTISRNNQRSVAHCRYYKRLQPLQTNDRLPRVSIAKRPDCRRLFQRKQIRQKIMHLLY